MLSFVSLKTIYLILHLLGLAIGAGGAFVSDVLYMESIKDKKITKDELRLMSIGGVMVWVGLFILTISGLLLMSLDFAKYAVSTKFIAKMIIVLIIAVNGAVIHHIYIPRMRQLIGNHLGLDPGFRRMSLYLYVSGAISFVSWVSTIVLGAIKKIPYNVPTILSVYLGFVLLAIAFSLLVRKMFLKK
ncbi:MAG: hypothetical protein COV34_02715 [Candidatus Zambryskibacteria bacterium CG10_big_fil_rev_8_21_14_0_10_42_12]|uniref:DUF2269 domain-containing protein n=1 Tax=Candidatus Zambryskibacteria bacterium CG10_big_fil_rev_8_21_14_0_10_42_12 TaxID=1975115 RepID=A0A2H0QWJ4_9BACT|nr:MAG: hypothetical protein COV34_02715 [Candidatus Zambryskibacteria bacterium CG10_big_fil_rev_8_21_14_0_10_42_12]